MAHETCDRCQGNGEVVTDWERYLHSQPGDEAVAECPDCDGVGYFCEPQQSAHSAKQDL